VTGELPATRPAPGIGEPEVVATTGTITTRGRAKAYRPLPPAEREQAFRAGVRTYEQGDFFRAHELLEPAWMGTADPGERDLHQGLIKLAAAYVHAVRGNPLGMAKNLTGARQRLGAALAVGCDPRGLDLELLLRQIDERLVRLRAHPDAVTLDAPRLDRRTR
jgi:predicted metal-dependent hydrolase